LNLFIRTILFFSVIIVISGNKLPPKKESKTIITIMVLKPETPRAKFGIDSLAHLLKNIGYEVEIISYLKKRTEQSLIISKGDTSLHKEGFSIRSGQKFVLVIGADDSGILYGCLKLAEEIIKQEKLPTNISITDSPEMPLRGQCIGLQKTTYLPGRTVYEYPYTPQTFPWFYDKKLWIQVLDSMLANRMNSLYLWNGHPFASLVKLKEYPYAVEVDDSTFKKNEEIYKFIAVEADKRGIWLIQMFYNIIVSKPFAERNHLKTQDRDRHIIPIIADYTRKSIAAFVQKYPNVGLLVCLGEAMEGIGNDDIEWFTKTIIPGVQDGLKALGKKDEPPIILRDHDTDAPSVLKAALPLYKNLYTMAKFNGEALTTPRPRGQWAELHRSLSKLAILNIENVHILANLEPFRYGSPEFIQQSIIGMHEVMLANGIHIYPQASYWDWPYSADRINGKRLLQIERDWIWYKAWARYAWMANRNLQDENKYWSGVLANKYGCTVEDGEKILEAYNESGQIAPKLLRRFGITDGNRQTLTLGMLMTQLINPTRFGLYTLLYEGEGPEGEMLNDYAEKEWKGEKHIGETPVRVMQEVKAHGDRALAAIEAITKNVTKNKKEFARLTNDMKCYRALAYHYSEKAAAALLVLRYKHSNDVADLQVALLHLQKSMENYKELVSLTKATYLYANSMQTQQRKIPLRGVNGTFKTWQEVLIPFEKELSVFAQKIDSLKQNKNLPVVQNSVLHNTNIDALNTGRFIIDSSAKIFPDTSLVIESYAKELKGLKGLVLPWHGMKDSSITFRFRASTPVKVLVGYFNSKDAVYARPPELETNAAANNYGQDEIKIANALLIKGMPPVNIHSFSFGAGTNTLTLPKGICLVLGFVDGKENIPVYDAGLTSAGGRNVDWLFE
jgi:hypothetical protein